MRRILFVDDDSKILDGIRRMLYADRKRWEMEFAVGGEAALKACESGSFDVVVSDMRMPGMDGTALLSHIRDRYPSTARIILSGYSGAASVTRAVPVAHRFLAKPCTAAELQSTIERVCALQDLLGCAELRRIVGTIGELPALSSTYTALTQALRNPETSISQVAKILENDIGMCAQVLHLVNSAFFGLAQTVTSLQAAVTYLGMDTIKNLTLVTETFRVFVPDARIPQSVCEALQQHAHRTATIAGRLPLNPKIRELTIVAALLHDIGRLVLACKLPDQFCSVLALVQERECECFEAEEELLGTSHAEIGAYLLGLWGIPQLAVEAIAHHHRPTRIPHSEFDSTVAIYVADLIARHGEDEKPLSPAQETCLQTLGLRDQFLEWRAFATA